MSAPAQAPQPGRAVLLGVGNILLTDEGIGVRAIERFERDFELPDNVEVLDGGTSAMEMLDDLEGLDLLVVVDCVRVGKAPASVVVLTEDEVPAFFRQRLSPHQVGLSDVFATMLLTGRAPRAIVVIGVQPVEIGLSMELTPQVEAVMPTVLEAIGAAFGSRGYPVKPRQVAEVKC
jgi:hydrogenase maturation protease